MDSISVDKYSSTGQYSDNNHVYQGFDADVDDEVRSLARQFTHCSELNNENDDYNNPRADNRSINSSAGLIRVLTSMSQVPGVIPIDSNIDPKLDPDSDQFDAKFWVKNMRKLIDSDTDHYKPISLGFAAKNLVARGVSSDADYQSDFLNYPFKIARDLYLNNFRNNDPTRYFEILKSMDVLVKPGTLTVVLGRPGAGCSTFLKTIAAQTYGFKVDPNSTISYDGLTQKEIKKNYRGEVIFSAETDNHFPNMTVGETLEFAALMRTPQN
ncbi:hypothetical protein CANINC_003177, partial [Pichia inconspicua]